MDNKNVVVPLYTASSAYPLQPGENSLAFVARYYATSSTVNAGFLTLPAHLPSITTNGYFVGVFLLRWRYFRGPAAAGPSLFVFVESIAIMHKGYRIFPLLLLVLASELAAATESGGVNWRHATDF